MAGDSTRIRVWWFKHGRNIAIGIAMVAWVVGTTIGYGTLTGFDDNPWLSTLLVVIWVVGVIGIAIRFGSSALPEQYWRPRVAPMAQWAKDHGGEEDPIPAQKTFFRMAVRAAIDDAHRNVWSAHAAPHGYPIWLLLHGVSGLSGATEEQRTAAAAFYRLPRIHYTVMIADTGVELPFLVVAVPQSDPDDFVLPDYTKRIEFESREFNETWEVRCVDVSTGHKVFDPRTIEILLELHAKDIRIVWDGTSAVVAREGLDVDAAELDRWLALIDRMVHNARLIARSG